MKSLVQSGQLEIVNGGYGANDEATPYFEDILDQMTYGLQYVHNVLDFRVKVGWNLDSFGSTLLHSYLLEHLGMTSVFTARMNYLEYQQLPNKTASFVMDTNQFRFKNILHNNSPGYGYRQEMMLDHLFA